MTTKQFLARLILGIFVILVLVLLGNLCLEFPELGWTLGGSVALAWAIHNA